MPRASSNLASVESSPDALLSRTVLAGTVSAGEVSAGDVSVGEVSAGGVAPGGVAPVEPPRSEMAYAALTNGTQASAPPAPAAEAFGPAMDTAAASVDTLAPSMDTADLLQDTASHLVEKRGSDYAGLCREVRAAGLLRRRPGAYAVRIALTLAFFAATWAAVAWVGDSWFQLVLAAVMGVASTQVAFLGHDGGHQQVFERRRWNDLFGLFVGNLLVGLSFGWWVGKHNRHHANPNKEDHDPDIGDGVLAFTTGQAASRTGWLGRAVLRRQAWLFFPLLPFEALHLRVASVRSFWDGGRRSRRAGHRAVEGALLAGHFALYLGALVVVMSPLRALVFVAVHQGVFGLYMGCSFAPNHKGMPTISADEDVDYLRRQVLTSRNVRGGVLTDLALGGLNYQIEHHLFPNMPRPSLRRAQGVVRAYCQDRQVVYTETSLIGSYQAALRYLNSLGAPLRGELVEARPHRRRIRLPHDGDGRARPTP